MTKRIHHNGCITNSWHFFPDYYIDEIGDSYQLQRRCDNNQCINKNHISYKLIADKGMPIIKKIDKERYTPERRAYVESVKNNPEALLDYYNETNSPSKTAKRFNVSKSFITSLVTEMRRVENEK